MCPPRLSHLGDLEQKGLDPAKLTVQMQLELVPLKLPDLLQILEEQLEALPAQGNRFPCVPFTRDQMKYAVYFVSN